MTLCPSVAHSIGWSIMVHLFACLSACLHPRGLCPYHNFSCSIQSSEGFSCAQRWFLKLVFLTVFLNQSCFFVRGIFKHKENWNYFAIVSLYSFLVSVRMVVFMFDPTNKFYMKITLVILFYHNTQVEIC